MPLNLSEWKSFTLDGDMNLEAAATIIRFRHYLIWSVPGNFGASSYNRTGQFTFKLKSGDTVLINMKVELTFNITTEGFGAFGGGLLFYSWYVAKEVITIDTIEGQTINPEDAYKWLWPKSSTTKTPLSLFGIMEFGSGYGDSTGEVFVQDAWMSPAFEINVPVGSKLEWQIDTWQAPAGKKFLYQFQVNEAPSISTFLDDVGGFYTARPEGNKLQILHGFNYTSNLSRRSYISRASEPSLFKDKTNRFWICARLDGNYRLWFSEDDAVTLNEYKTGGVDVIIWTDEYKNAHTVPLSDGTMISIANAGNKLYVKKSADGWTTAREVATISQNKPFQVIARNVASGHDEIIITDSYSETYKSTDGGLTFTAVTN